MQLGLPVDFSKTQNHLTIGAWADWAMLSSLGGAATGQRGVGDRGRDGGDDRGRKEILRHGHHDQRFQTVGSSSK